MHFIWEGGDLGEGKGGGSELLSHLLHRYPYHLCIECDSPSLPLPGLTAVCQVCRQHWRPNRQPQTLSHCMSLDSSARVNCSTVRHQMTPCAHPSPDTRELHTEAHSRQRHMHRARGASRKSRALPRNFSNNAFSRNIQYLTPVWAST